MTFSTVDTIRGNGGYTPIFGRATVDYDLDAQSRLSANLHFNTPNLHQRGSESIVSDDGSGAVVQSETRAASYDYSFTGFGGGVSYRHNFSGDAHDLTLSVSRDRDTHDFDFRFADANLVPAQPDDFDEQIARAVRYRSVIKADYEQPMPESARSRRPGLHRTDDDDERAALSSSKARPRPRDRSIRRRAICSTSTARSRLSTPPISSRSASGRCWAACGSKPRASISTRRRNI